MNECSHKWYKRTDLWDICGTREAFQTRGYELKKVRRMSLSFENFRIYQHRRFIVIAWAAKKVGKRFVASSTKHAVGLIYLEDSVIFMDSGLKSPKILTEGVKDALLQRISPKKLKHGPHQLKKQLLVYEVFNN